jgi:hypothetical protein
MPGGRPSWRQPGQAVERPEETDEWEALKDEAEARERLDKKARQKPEDPVETDKLKLPPSQDEDEGG